MEHEELHKARVTLTAWQSPNLKLINDVFLHYTKYSVPVNMNRNKIFYFEIKVCLSPPNSHA